MNLNPGQWFICNALKCESLKKMECGEEKCPYGTCKEKRQLIRARTKERFDAAHKEDADAEK